MKILVVFILALGKLSHGMTTKYTQGVLASDLIHSITKLFQEAGPVYCNVIIQDDVAPALGKIPSSLVTPLYWMQIHDPNLGQASHICKHHVILLKDPMDSINQIPWSSLALSTGKFAIIIFGNSVELEWLENN